MNYQGVTDQWVKEVVIDLGLCPFAGKSILEKRLSTRVITSTVQEKIFEEFIEEIYSLENDPNLESSLITVPNAFSSFDSFLEAIAFSKELLSMSGFAVDYQVAFFHPQFVFEGVEENDPSNFTNRSPYPTFHPIKEKAMSRAIDSHAEIESVPLQNIEKTRNLGLDHMQNLLKNCYKAN
ncbi:MAG: DUF1415 family protein [Saprospiraceae bacterium]|nr:DUF1415 family protein [Saprospiraceae bacterium]